MNDPGANRPLPLAADPWLAPYRNAIAARRDAMHVMASRLTGGRPERLAEWAGGHCYYGLRRDGAGWVFREWAPNVRKAWLIGDFNGWKRLGSWRMERLNPHGDWELRLSAGSLKHGDHYLVEFEWPGGGGRRIPAYADCVVQDEKTHLFSALVYAPERPYCFCHSRPETPGPVLIYEAHAGMATEAERVGTFAEFRRDLLPRIKADGYNTVQMMAVLGHPYYGSFGYHVANFFAVTSRFGTPDEFRELVDAAHGLGLRVIIDLVHSHAVKNEAEGLSRFDGTAWQYFHAGDRGEHANWDSRIFDYSKPEVLHFLLSNCRYWLEEYRVDGFRFDGVTSMLYHHHGLGKAFAGYGDYFDGSVDGDAYTYLGLANRVIHEIAPSAITVAEDVSGMPGLAAPLREGGCGFDYRLAMGVTDYWFKLFDIPDGEWSMETLWRELTNRRADERTISYVECHDQAIVGGQTAIFRLAGGDMYGHMSKFHRTEAVERGVALHKMVRLVTLAAAADGYLNFMGNEFGHPEWIDFPREGNGWSYRYARRQWSLAERGDLRYHELGDFDRAMLELFGDPGVFARKPQLARLDEAGKVLVFERGGLWVFANFHPDESHAGYSVEVLPGRYELVLDSDAPRFGGAGRVEPEQVFTATDRLTLYLPTRTALVLRRIR